MRSHHQKNNEQPEGSLTKDGDWRRYTGQHMIRPGEKSGIERSRPANADINAKTPPWERTSPVMKLARTYGGKWKHMTRSTRYKKSSTDEEGEQFRAHLRRLN